MIRTVVLGLAETVCVIATAWVVARLGSDLLVSRIVPTEDPTALAVVASALILRAAAVWLTQVSGHRAATSTIAQLRSQLVQASGEAGPRGRLAGAASTATLATTGLENLRPYLTGFVPQLVLSATLTPLSLAAIAYWDLTSAIIACVAIPLIPIFMILIGKMTEGASHRSLETMRTLWAQTLDLVEGLPTLRALGRAEGSTSIVATLGAAHKKTTMGTLAYAFLSSLALELIATLGVALIAVSIGMRLVSGTMELFPAIAVLILAAEVYLPLRLVGQQFHASTDGLAALDATFEIINAPRKAPGKHAAPDLSTTAIVIESLSIRGRESHAPYRLNVRIEPGTITALRGGSGEGKSTTLAAILGLVEPTEGCITLEAREHGADHPGDHQERGSANLRAVKISDTDLTSYWSQITWLPQRPLVEPGTLREIVENALPDGVGPTTHKAQELIATAARKTGLDQHVISHHGWDFFVGRGGIGLSVGQRQRLALTTALLSPKALVILDEPTAHLDGASETTIIQVISELKSRGSTVLMAAHRESLIDIADTVITVRAQKLEEATAS